MSRGLVLDPSLVVSLEVIPFLLKLVVKSPHEVTFDGPVVDVEGALTEAHDLVFWVVSGVNSAHAVLDVGVVAGHSLAVLTPWVRLLFGTVKVNSLGGHVGVWALNTGARTVSINISVGILEASEPGGANISGKRPLANPDGVLDAEGGAQGATIVITVGTDVTVGAPPGEVLMGVHDNVVHIIIFEEIVPVGSEAE